MGNFRRLKQKDKPDLFRHCNVAMVGSNPGKCKGQKYKKKGNTITNGVEKVNIC